jgi:hypothetical protein
MGGENFGRFELLGRFQVFRGLCSFLRFGWHFVLLPGLHCRGGGEGSKLNTDMPAKDILTRVPLRAFDFRRQKAQQAGVC